MTGDEKRGYELDDEMKALLDAKRERLFDEASCSPKDAGHFADDDWTAPDLTRPPAPDSGKDV